MKKLTRILAVLAAVTTLTVSAVHSYAEEADLDMSDEPKHIDFNDDSIPKSEKACICLNSFITDNDLCAFAYPAIKREGTPDCYWDQYGQVHICCKCGDTRTKELIQSYINENDSDPSMYEFTEYDDLEKLFNEAELLRNYFEENQWHGSIDLKFTSDETFFDKWNDCSPELVLRFRLMHRDESIEEKICNFLEENGFDKSTISFKWFKDKALAGMPNPDADRGDANGDGEISVRDCAYITGKLAERKGSELPKKADYNLDGKRNVRDAAALASYLAKNYH